MSDENSGSEKPDKRTVFEEWCALRELDPNKELEKSFWSGVDYARSKLGNPAPFTLKLAPFTGTVVQAYSERDQARAEVKELTRHLKKAHGVNGKMCKLLEAARELLKEYDS